VSQREGSLKKMPLGQVRSEQANWNRKYRERVVGGLCGQVGSESGPEARNIAI
jgi:hypothetical protein